MKTRWSLFVILFIFHVDIFAFNVDLRYSLVYQTDLPGDYFGFSVALHPGSQSQDDLPWMMVGAPRSNTSNTPHVNEPGRVLQCVLGSPCHEMNLKQNSRTRNENLERSMLGSAQDMFNEKYVTCASRWMIKTTERNELYGECYLSSAKLSQQRIRSPDKLQPLNTGKNKAQVIPGGRGYADSFQPYFIYGQAGFAAHFPTVVSTDQYEMVLGAPGVFNWHGTTILYRDAKNSNGPPKQVIIPNPYNVKKSAHFGLFGYALSSGRYFQRSQTLHAAGAPRSNQVGHVILYEFPRKSHEGYIIKKLLDGLQIGEYFGAALSSCDINNDGLDDLFVGAPLFSISQDEGRVYLFIGNIDGFADTAGSIVITGSSTKNARFGATISCIGDLDHDGFEEVAIAAPYEGEGVVYIYSFAANGEWKLTQRILGSEVAPDMRGFGYSISRGQDVDGNGYNDLAVGAHNSGHAALLRSRPVVSLNAVLVPLVEKDGLPRNSTKLHVMACIKYNGFQLADTLEIKQIVEVDPRLQRVFIGTDVAQQTYSQESYLTLHGQNEDNCFTLNFTVKSKLTNLLDPIPVIAAYNLVPDVNEHKPRIIKGGISSQDDDFFCKTCPVIKNGEDVVADTSIQFATECKNNVCKSQISVALQFSDLDANGFIVGSANSLKLQVSVLNAEGADPAYYTYVHIDLPVRASKFPLQCNEIEANSVGYTLICDAGNPLRGGIENMRHIDITLDMHDVTATHQNFEISALASTKSEDSNKEDNAGKLSLILSAHADITVSGKSGHELYFFDTKDNDEGTTKRKVAFNFQYQVEKFGISPVDEVELSVEFPIAMPSGKGFLNLARPEFTLNSRPLACKSDFAFAESSKLLMDSSVMAFEANRHKRQIEEKIESTPQADGGIQSRDSMTDFPVNRTLFINCTSSHWQCSQVKCLAGPFLNRQAFAKLELTMVLDTSVLERELGLRDIILYATTANVQIFKPRNIQQPEDGSPDRAIVSATFQGNIPEGRVETWVLALSVIGGIMLLMMLVTGLIKAGFFERKQKDALIKLKRETQLDLAAFQRMHDMEDLDVEEDLADDNE